MSKAWDSAIDRAAKNIPICANQDPLFTLAHDGDEVTLVILGDPYSYEMTYDEGRHHTKLYTIEPKPRGSKFVVRIAINVAVYSTKTVMVLDSSPPLFKEIIAVRNKYGLDKWAFVVSRRYGTPDQTLAMHTSYSALPEHQLTDAERAEFVSLPLHNLQKVVEEHYR